MKLYQALSIPVAGVLAMTSFFADKAAANYEILRTSIGIIDCERKITIPDPLLSVSGRPPPYVWGGVEKNCENKEGRFLFWEGQSSSDHEYTLLGVKDGQATVLERIRARNIQSGFYFEGNIDRFQKECESFDSLEVRADDNQQLATSRIYLIDLRKP